MHIIVQAQPPKADSMAQDSFGSLAEIARIANAEEALATMVEVGWTTPSAVKQHSAEWSKLGLSKSQQAMLKATLDMWGARLERQPSRPGRSDLPQLKPATQGSLQRALDAAKPNQREEALKLFRADVFAKSNTSGMQPAQHLAEDSDCLGRATVATHPISD